MDAPLWLNGGLGSFCRDEYFRMKVQWKSVSEGQEMRNSLLKGYRNLIGEQRLSPVKLCSECLTVGM